MEGPDDLTPIAHAATARTESARAAEARAGVMYGVAAYLWWGFVPIYFKAVAQVAPLEVLAHRVAWSVVLLALLLRVRRRLPDLLKIARNRVVLATLFLTTWLLAANWLTFIYAVTTDRLLQASLGYYINPLVNVLLGFLFLHERLNRRQWVSVALAAIGVSYLTISMGTLPWLSMILAVSFGFYGLFRKTVRADALVGLSIETGLLAPLAIAYMAYIGFTGKASFGHVSLSIDLLLPLGGVITAVPLIWFSNAARRLRLATVGFLQYLAPSLQFLLAVLLYGEVFTLAHFVSFSFIWAALLLYSYDTFSRVRT